MTGFTLDELTDEPDYHLIPWLDQWNRAYSDRALFLNWPLQRQWAAKGVAKLPKFIPDELVDAYNAAHPGGALGWDWETPYSVIPEVKDLCLYKPLTDVLEDLIGEPMGLHLNLTGWRSTQRDWHQDDYLNPPQVNGHYLAVWIATGDIHPDAGPFQYVPESHLWPVLRREKILAALGQDGSDPMWPKYSEALLSPLYERFIDDGGYSRETYLPEKGDVLVWHSWLLHRGSKPINPNLERRTCIAHYSGIHHRADMPEAIQHDNGSWYFPIDSRREVSRDVSMTGLPIT